MKKLLLMVALLVTVMPSGCASCNNTRPDGETDQSPLYNRDAGQATTHGGYLKRPLSDRDYDINHDNVGGAW
jgi:hypothetical protein